MPATIKEVAERAVVSVSTVSRVLNDYPHVSEDARRRVLEAMEELEYRPDVAARSMRTGTSRAVGFVVDDFSNPLFSTIAKGADLVLYEQGYSLVLANSSRDVAREADAIAALRQRRVDGLIVALVDERAPSLSELLGSFNAAVVLDRDVPGVDAVHPDHATGMGQALEHLASLGHRRIALVVGPQSQRGSRMRVEAYRAHLRRLRVPLDRRLVRVGGLDADTGYAETSKLLALDPRPTAVMAGSNQIFIGVIAALREAKLRIPRDMSLVTCDDVDATRLHEPPVDVIYRDPLEMGRAAGELLLARLADREAPPRRVTVPTAFLRRGSSAVPAGAPA